MEELAAPLPKDSRTIGVRGCLELMGILTGCMGTAMWAPMGVHPDIPAASRNIGRSTAQQIHAMPCGRGC